MNPNAEMSRADRKELKDDLNKSVPEDQHCQSCGEGKETVDYSIKTGYKFLCNKCLNEVVQNQH